MEDGGSWLEYVHYERVDKANRGLSYTPEHTSDLVSNVWINGGYSVVGTGTIDFEFDAVTNRVSTESENERFIRLVIEADDIVVADFDGGSYAGWIATGTAFGSAPATGTLPNQQPVTGFEGAGLVNSYLGGDPSTGTLTSPEFTIQREYINFLIGGGNHQGETCVNLLIDGVVVRTQTGADEEQLKWAYWDVSDLIGQSARIEIVDDSTGSWGHINVDSMVQSDEQSWREIELTVQVGKKYLNIPIENAFDPEWVYLYVDGEETMDYYCELELADPAHADFWVYMDVERYIGHDITLVTRRDFTKDPAAFEQCYQSDEPLDGAAFYQEATRPQFHFSSRRGWINDVNGPVYYNGTYHLFYQHNPYGWSWGNMHWGHATSTDLIHWIEAVDAVLPDELGTIYSGTAVVDELNTGGFQTGSDLSIVAFYTAAGDHAPEKVLRSQAMAYSTDGGATFAKYAGNPVLDHIAGGNRDPKVFWHPESGKWVMVLYLEGSTFAFFNSPDLKAWTETSRFEFSAGAECPDLFPLAVDGDTNTLKWVFWTGNSSYSLGSFDGSAFTPEGDVKMLYAGGNGYAAQTFNNVPASDGRLIQISWMNSRGAAVFEGMPFNQQMSFPVELTLHSTTNGPRMRAWPVDEIESLHATTQSFPGQLLTTSSANLLAGMESDMQDVHAEFELVNNSATFGFEIRGVEFIYHAATRQIEADGNFAGLEPVDGKINMRLLIDGVSVEFFAGDGQVYLPMYLAPPETNSAMKIFTRDDSVTLKTLEVNGLDSVWD
ncbi:MAG: 2,6-beta-D-fructofuranosidase [Verrucomicrobia bacterium]|nr:MAG: 2,6-beta-D-fructofuranosidase [Verrucomicrobiota bacterium]